MELQNITNVTPKENTYTPKETLDSSKDKRFSAALEKVASEDIAEKQEVDNTSDKTATKTVEVKPDNIKGNEGKGNKSSKVEKSSEETSDVDPSLQGLMAMIQAFTNGKIDLNTFLSGASKEIKGLVEQKNISRLNGLASNNLTERIKALSLALTKNMEGSNLKETTTKDLPSAIMEKIQGYIETLKSGETSTLGKSDVQGNLQDKSKIEIPSVVLKILDEKISEVTNVVDTTKLVGKSDVQGNLQDKIKVEISNIVLNTLKENGVKVTNAADGVKVVNLSQAIKVDNVAKVINTKEIQKAENTMASLTESSNDSTKVKLGNAEGNQMSSEQNSSNKEKNSMSHEEKILKSIIAPEKENGNKESSIIKVTNFIAQFEPIRNEKITPETLVINKNNFAEDIVKSVKFMQISNLKDLTVTIAPKELGEVIIKLTMDGGIMKASITTTNKEAYNILNSNLTDITNKLNTLDTKIQDFTLNIYNGDTTFFKQGSSEENSNKQNSKNSKNVMEEVEEVSLDSDINSNNQNNVNILA